MVTLYFDKMFTQGLMKGCRVSEKMQFVDIKAARDWSTGVSEKNAAGECDYFVSWVDVVEN